MPHHSLIRRGTAGRPASAAVPATSGQGMCAVPLQASLTHGDPTPLLQVPQQARSVAHSTAQLDAHRAELPGAVVLQRFLTAQC